MLNYIHKHGIIIILYGGVCNTMYVGIHVDTFIINCGHQGLSFGIRYVLSGYSYCVPYQILNYIRSQSISVDSCVGGDCPIFLCTHWTNTINWPLFQPVCCEEEVNWKLLINN